MHPTNDARALPSGRRHTFALESDLAWLYVLALACGRAPLACHLAWQHARGNALAAASADLPGDRRVLSTLGQLVYQLGGVA